MPETHRTLDERLLSDLYLEQRVGWEKLLSRLGLPANIGITRTMTVGQAKALAARTATRGAGGVVQTGSKVVMPSTEQPGAVPKR